jgi:hypothetical protein
MLQLQLVFCNFMHGVPVVRDSISGFKPILLPSIPERQQQVFTPVGSSYRQSSVNLYKNEGGLDYVERRDTCSQFILTLPDKKLILRNCISCADSIMYCSVFGCATRLITSRCQGCSDYLLCIRL